MVVPSVGRYALACHGLKLVIGVGRPDMIHALTVLAALVALAGSAAPTSSAGRAHGRVGEKMHLEVISLGIVTENCWWTCRR
jgi:hypothetical protein